MLNVHSLSFDLTDCTPYPDKPDERRWMYKSTVAHLLRFAKQPVSWPFDLTEIAVARDFYSEQCASAGGVMLSMDVHHLDKVEVLQGLFKYRAPEGMAMLYVGILWIPFSDCNYQLNIEAMEHGTTGIREAVVFDLSRNDSLSGEESNQSSWPEAKVHEPAEVVSSAAEMFEKMRAKPIMRIPSDDEKYDAMFSNHPLSMVRARLKRVTETLKMDETWWQTIKPFRLRAH